MPDPTPFESRVLVLLESVQSDVQLLAEGHLALRGDFSEMKKTLDEHTEQLKDLPVVKQGVAELKKDMVVVRADVAELKKDMVEVKSDLADVKTRLTKVDERTTRLETKADADRPVRRKSRKR